MVPRGENSAEEVEVFKQFVFKIPCIGFRGS